MKCSVCGHGGKRARLSRSCTITQEWLCLSCHVWAHHEIAWLSMLKGYYEGTRPVASLGAFQTEDPTERLA